ncbi:hypothetical protein [Nocardia sp. XZ_19_231]|uniref:hypothetical protein n=1 Tax=Nocardia sp. XZ_19_231 TaxID=2769252 RepID=UPI00188FD459|nr:hypothetical protein [Nocardia sp. XZ_19_231]
MRNTKSAVARSTRQHTRRALDQAATKARGRSAARRDDLAELVDIVHGAQKAHAAVARGLARHEGRIEKWYAAALARLGALRDLKLERARNAVAADLAVAQRELDTALLALAGRATIVELRELAGLTNKAARSAHAAARQR